MPNATLQLIEAVERLGDDDVTGGPAVSNHLHDLAAAARLEQYRERYPAIASAWRGCCHTRAPGAHDQECVGL